MAGLVLNLRPYEKFLVNGVVMQNGQRRTQLRICDDAAGVLRFTDALHPDDVRTPLTRAYYAAQSLITGDGDPQDTAPLLDRLLEDAVAGFQGFSFVSVIKQARDEAAIGNLYKVLKTLRPLLAKEAAILLAINKPAEAVNP